MDAQEGEHGTQGIRKVGRHRERERERERERASTRLLENTHTKAK